MVKLPYLIPSNIIKDTLTPTDVIKGLIMGYTDSSQSDNASTIDPSSNQRSVIIAADDTVAQTIATQMQSESGGVIVGSFSPSLRPESCNLTTVGMIS